MFEIAHLFDLMGGSRDEMGREIGELISNPEYLNEWLPGVWVTGYVDWRLWQW